MPTPSRLPPFRNGGGGSSVTSPTGSPAGGYTGGQRPGSVPGGQSGPYVLDLTPNGVGSPGSTVQLPAGAQVLRPTSDGYGHFDPSSTAQLAAKAGIYGSFGGTNNAYQPAPNTPTSGYNSNDPRSGKYYTGGVSQNVYAPQAQLNVTGKLLTPQQAISAAQQSFAGNLNQAARNYAAGAISGNQLQSIQAAQEEAIRRMAAMGAAGNLNGIAADNWYGGINAAANYAPFIMQAPQYVGQAPQEESFDPFTPGFSGGVNHAPMYAPYSVSGTQQGGTLVTPAGAWNTGNDYPGFQQGMIYPGANGYGGYDVPTTSQYEPNNPIADWSPDSEQNYWNGPGYRSFFGDPEAGYGPLGKRINLGVY